VLQLLQLQYSTVPLSLGVDEVARTFPRTSARPLPTAARPLPPTRTGLTAAPLAPLPLTLTLTLTLTHPHSLTLTLTLTLPLTGVTAGPPLPPVAPLPW
jgi:hypothetical protein